MRLYGPAAPLSSAARHMRLPITGASWHSSTGAGPHRPRRGLDRLNWSGDRWHQCREGRRPALRRELRADTGLPCSSEKLQPHLPRDRISRLAAYIAGGWSGLSDSGGRQRIEWYGRRNGWHARHGWNDRDGYGSAWEPCHQLGRNANRQLRCADTNTADTVHHDVRLRLRIGAGAH